VSSYVSTQLAFLTLPTVPHGLPAVIDDVSLAYSMGLRPKTLWWAVRGCRELAGTPNSLYAKAGILKRGSAGKRGSVRAIHIPEHRLKNIQKVLGVTFVKPIPVGPHVAAYEPGVKPLDAAKKLAGSKLVFSFDLKNFFGSIKLSWVRAYYEGLGYPRQVANIIAQLCCCSDAHPSQSRSVRFLPQGTVISPALANRIGDARLDSRILPVAAAAGWTYLRYSDNIFMGHPDLLDRPTTDAFKQRILTEVGRSGWRFHKVRVAPFWRRQTVLGAVVNDKANLAQNEYQALRALVHNCLVHGFDSQVAKAGAKIKPSITTDEKLISHMRGKLSYVKGLLEPARYDRLVDDFTAAMEAHRVRVASNWKKEDATDTAEAGSV
jgi:RNA-directed DNA polymerase